jgi:NOL1/NOP2/fmu family ribosome biogenesis protein
MDTLEILPKKKVTEIVGMLDARWDPGMDLSGYAVYMNSKNRLYIIDRKIREMDLSRLRVNSVGLYFGELYNNELRLSVDAAQLVGKTAKKNIVHLSPEQKELWMQGMDFMIDEDGSGYVIVECNGDILGCGKLSNNKLYNYLPKERRKMSV